MESNGIKTQNLPKTKLMEYTNQSEFVMCVLEGGKVNKNDAT